VRRPRGFRRPGRGRAWLWLLGLLLVAALSFADRRGWLLVPQSDEYAVYHGVHAAVTHVVDGDTLDVAWPDPQTGRSSTRIRLWGIDSPEMPRPGQPGEPWAQQASDAARSLADQTVVTLRLQRQRVRDRYGRVLAYVELADGTSLGEVLLQRGLARADDRWPHDLLGRYAQHERAAQRAGVGIWSGQLDEQTTSAPAAPAATGSR
jgi:micrococcal nuclease